MTDIDQKEDENDYITTPNNYKPLFKKKIKEIVYVLRIFNKNLKKIIIRI